MKKKVVSILLILIFTLLTAVYVIKSEDPAALSSMPANIKYGYFSAAIALMVIYWLFDGFLLMKLVESVSRKIVFKHSFHISMAVQFFNAATPFAGGGQPVAVYLLKRKGLTYGESTAVVVIKSLVWQGTLLAITVFTLILNFGYLTKNIAGFFPLFVIGVVTNLALILFYCMFFSRSLMTKIMNGLCNILSKTRLRKSIVKMKENLNREIALMASALKKLREHKKEWAELLLATCVQITAFCSVLYFIQAACEPSVSDFFDLLTSQTMVTMISGLIPSPGAAGGAEGIGYIFFKRFFKPTSILAAVLIWRFIIYYLNLLIGGVFCLINKDRPLKLKKRAESTANKGAN